MFLTQVNQAKGHVRPACLVLSLSTMALGWNFPMAQAKDLSSEERYQLCSSFPHNSRCEGYTAPVALGDRPGEEGHCVQHSADTKQGGKCKFVTSEKGITAYIETGEPLNILEDQRNTLAVSLGYDQVQALEYREFTKRNNTNRAVNTFLFGAIGFFATRDKPVSEVVVRYAPILEASDAAAESLEQLSLIFERDKGYSVRTHLESKTELRAGIPVDELPSVEEADAVDGES